MVGVSGAHGVQAFNCVRKAQWRFGQCRENKVGERKKEAYCSSSCKIKEASVRAQGQVKVSQLASRLIAEVKILDAFSRQSPWDLVYTNKSEGSIWEYTNGSCLQGPHRSNRWDALALNTLLMYCQGFSHVTQFTSWEDLHTPIREPELKLSASFYFPSAFPLAQH